MKLKNSALVILASLAAVTAISALAADSKVAPAPNGITLPEAYKDWRLIAPAYRTDKKHVRAIIGNDIAIAAARSNKTNPCRMVQSWASSREGKSGRRLASRACAGHIRASRVHGEGCEEIRQHRRLGLCALARHGPETVWHGRQFRAGMRCLSHAGEVERLRVHRPAVLP